MSSSGENFLSVCALFKSEIHNGSLMKSASNPANSECCLRKTGQGFLLRSICADLAELDQQIAVMNWTKMTWKIPASCTVLTAEQ